MNAAVRCRSCGASVSERVSPVREFPTFRGQRNFPGSWWSQTTGGHVGYESWLQRDQVMLLDFDPGVVSVSSQPFWLTWSSAGGSRRHAPDFFARLSDGTAVVMDVCADDRVKPVAAEVLAVTVQACESVGWPTAKHKASDSPPGGADGSWVWSGRASWLS